MGAQGQSTTKGKAGRLTIGGRVACELRDWQIVTDGGGETITASIRAPDEFWLDFGDVFDAEMDYGSSIRTLRGVTILSRDTKQIVLHKGA